MPIPGYTAEASLVKQQQDYAPAGRTFTQAPGQGSVVPAGLGWFISCAMVTFGHPACLLALLIPE